MDSKIKIIRDTLLKVSDNVGHYEAKEKNDQYIVWAEDSEGSSVEGDNRKENQSIQGTIDYFTRTEFDPMVDDIQEALIDAEISFYLNSVQYEDETKYTHYEWVWEVG